MSFPHIDHLKYVLPIDFLLSAFITLLQQKWINFWIFHLVDKKLVLPSAADIYAPQSECWWSGFIGLFRSLKLCNVKPLDTLSLLLEPRSLYASSQSLLFFLFPYRLISFSCHKTKGACCIIQLRVRCAT